MAPKCADDVFVALLKSYHSDRFCRRALQSSKREMPTRVPGRGACFLAVSTARIHRNGKQISPRLAVLPANRKSYATTAVREPPKEIAIIGGGITGLTTAHYLAKWLPSSSKITIYEGSERLGGWIDTHKVETDIGGKRRTVQFERGPRTLRVLSKETWRMDDLVFYDLANDVNTMPAFSGGKVAKRRYIYYPDHLVGLNGESFWREQLFKGIIPSVGWFAVQRTMARLFKRGTATKDLSLGDWARSAFGRPGIVDNMLSAVVHGIWGGDVDRLSMRSFNPSGWYHFSHRSRRDRVAMPAQDWLLLQRMKENEGAAVASASSKDMSVMNFRDGMGSLVQAVVEGLEKYPNVEVKLGEPVSSLEHDGKTGKIAISTQKSQSPAKYDKVISTLHSKALSAVVGKALPSLADTHAVTIMMVNLWYPKPNLNAPYNGLGYLIPRSVTDNPEGCLGVFFDSDILVGPKSEPEGTKLAVLLGGHHWDDAPSYPTEAEAIAQAKAIVARHLRIPADEPCVAVAKLAHECIPQQYVGHRDLMARADAELQAGFGGRLAVAGSSYTAIGLLASIRAGYDVAFHLAREPQEHVGDTGLAQFADGVEPAIVQVERQHLIDIGRDIKPQENWVDKLTK